MSHHTKKQTALPSVSKVRLTAYVAAGAATAAGYATTAQADIHYFDVTQTFNAAPGSYQLNYFNLAGAANFGLIHSRTSSGTRGVAKFGIFGANSRAFAGFSAGGFPYVARLGLNANIAAQAFAAGAIGTMAYGFGYGNDQWLTAGTGYIGFKFNLGGGVQYGWARVVMNEGAPGNSFTLSGYAYGDVGDAVRTGQTAIPEPGSLALLALGGAGLLAWRQRRAKAAMAA